MSKQNPALQLNNLLISKDFEPNLLGRDGKPATPEAAEVISFDYVGPSGQDYGTVAILLGEENQLDVYFGDNLGKSMEGDDKNAWFQFLQQIRQFSKRNLMSFGVANLNKLKYSMSGQAAIKEGLFESWSGNRTQSWTQYPNEVKLVIHHKRPLGENDKRYRYIKALFLETTEGERFKLPFTKLSGGRAMVEHVRQGGKPYDIRGNHISEMVNDLNLLSQFKRANRNQIFEGEVATLVNEAAIYHENLKRNLGALSSSRGYQKYFESWKASELNKEELIIEDLKGLFVTQTLDTRIEQALPLLAKLQQENNMKELSIFEGWLGCLTEGTWSLPDTPEKQQKLIDLLAEEFPVGTDAINATEQLYDILGDDKLFDSLADLARNNADADARSVIIHRLEEMKSSPAIAQVIGQLSVATAPQPEKTEQERIEIKKEVSESQRRARSNKLFESELNHIRMMSGNGFAIKESFDRVKNVKQIAQEYMEMNHILLATDLTAEDIEAIGGDAQMNYEDVCDILGCELPAELGPVQSWEYDEEGNKVDLEERGGLSAVGKNAHWQSYKGGAKPWNESEEADEKEKVELAQDQGIEVSEGAMKELMWKDAERMERDEFCEKYGEENGDFWDAIMGDIDEGIKGALGGAAIGALAGGPAGAVRGAQIGNVVGDMVDESMESFEFPDDGRYGYKLGGGDASYGSHGQFNASGLSVIDSETGKVVRHSDFTYFDEEPTQDDLEYWFNEEELSESAFDSTLARMKSLALIK